MVAPFKPGGRVPSVEFFWEGSWKVFFGVRNCEDFRRWELHSLVARATLSLNIKEKNKDDFLTQFKDVILNDYFTYESFDDFMDDKGFGMIKTSLAHEIDFVKEYPSEYKHCTDGNWQLFSKSIKAQKGQLFLWIEGLKMRVISADPVYLNDYYYGKENG